VNVSVRFITFEGIDGSGKTTQIKMLENELKRVGKKYRIFREPGGTQLSEKIRKILLDRENIDLSPIAESLLFAAARTQLVEEEIKPSIAKGEFVICDRFIDSTIAYQGYGRRLDVKNLEELNRIATASIIPDITFILDMDPGKAMGRIEQETPDRMETIGVKFINKVREGYNLIAEQNPDRCVKINGDQRPEYVFKDIYRVIMKRFEEEL